MAYKKETSEVFSKFVAQANKLKQIKKICDTMLQQPYNKDIKQTAENYHAFIKGFKTINDIVEDKNENK